MIDLGFDIVHLHIIRLHAIDTPEIRGEEREEGLKVKEYVRNLIEGKDVYLKSINKRDKYGRCVANIILIDTNQDLTELLLEKEMGKPYLALTEDVLISENLWETI